GCVPRERVARPCRAVYSVAAKINETAGLPANGRLQAPRGTRMPDATAPFRADQVGSLLRSAPLKEARAKHAKAQITAAELPAVEAEEIGKTARKQEEAGLEVATDGEFRRTWWQFDFFGGLDGVEIYQAERGIQFKGIETAPRAIRVTGKVGFPPDHP